MNLESLIEGLSPSGLFLDRDRPYEGQPHTFYGDRGAYLIHGVTIRDILDAFTLACFESSGLSQKDWPSTIYDLPWHSIDPVSVLQNLGCNIEKLMDVYPNIPGRDS